MQVLITKARVEAEDAQRVLLAALNGLAAVFVIQGDAPEAVATYRQVPIRILSLNLEIIIK